MGPGFRDAFKAGISFGKDDMVDPREGRDWSTKPARSGEGVRAAVSGRPDHPGRKYNKVVDAWSHRRKDRVANAMMTRDLRRRRRRGRRVDQNSINMMATGRAWFAGADEAAGRHARPDGQAVGRDHRDADHLELPEGLTVLEYFNSTHGARRACRHRAEDRELGLPDPPPWSTWRRTAIVTEDDAAPRTAITMRAIVRTARSSIALASASSAASRRRRHRDPGRPRSSPGT